MPPPTGKTRENRRSIAPNTDWASSLHPFVGSRGINSCVFSTLLYKRVKRCVLPNPARGERSKIILPRVVALVVNASVSFSKASAFTDSVVITGSFPNISNA